MNWGSCAPPLYNGDDDNGMDNNLSYSVGVGMVHNKDGRRLIMFWLALGLIGVALLVGFAAGSAEKKVKGRCENMVEEKSKTLREKIVEYIVELSGHTRKTAEIIADAIFDICSCVDPPVDPLLVAGIIAKESKFDLYAMGDASEADALDKRAGFKSSYKSFGLMQINTAKDVGTYSTFDRMCIFSGLEEIVRAGWKVQSKRDDDVILARKGNISSPLYNIRANIAVGVQYLSYIEMTRGLDPSDYYNLAQLYNRGDGAELLKKWEYSDDVLMHITKIESM